jgi:uncharacterized repeat protein (TIGR04138 family)
MQEASFEEALEKILARDSRYQRDAYFFVREALDFTQKNVVKENRTPIKSAAGQEEKHVTGQELLEGVRELALKEFGPMAMMVLEEWGIRACADFGEIVFNMVNTGWLRKTEKDTRDDFRNGYDFFEAFRKPFLPATKAARRAPKPAVN